MAEPMGDDELARLRATLGERGSLFPPRQVAAALALLACLPPPPCPCAPAPVRAYRAARVSHLDLSGYGNNWLCWSGGRGPSRRTPVAPDCWCRVDGLPCGQGDVAARLRGGGRAVTGETRALAGTVYVRGPGGEVCGVDLETP